MPELRVVINGESTTAFPLTDETVTLGRDAVNTIVLPDKSASSLHAQILAGEDGWQIEDLGSTNGTLVNDRRIHTVYLRDGDRIRIGMTEIVYSDSTDPTNVSDSNVGSIDYFRSMLSSSDGQIDSTALPCFVIDDSTPPLSDEAVAFAEVDAAANPKKRLSSHRTIVLNPAESTPSKAAPRFTPENPVEHLAETKLRLVQQVSEKLVRIFEPQQLLDEIMRIVVDQTGADRGLLCLLDDSRQPFPIAARGMRGDEEIRVSRTVLGRLLEGRKGLLLDPSQEEDSKAFRSLEEMQVQSTMCVPLWTGDRIVGILSLDSVTLGKRFSHQDLELLLAVAHQVAIGIERNRLSQQIETGRHLRDYLSKYLDHRVVAQISDGQRTGHDPLAPTEREVTILFSDIVSFTKLSESLSAVDLAEFMRRYLTSMTDVVFSYGGTIDKYMGDAVMALFGAPVPSDNSAEAAIRAALAMRDRIQEFELPGAKGRALRVRVGINTGQVVVGNLGSDRRTEYTALGDAVNVASRLETFARPNEICIDENTYEKTKGAFDVEEIGTIDIKNRAEPVVVYKVISAT